MSEAYQIAIIGGSFAILGGLIAAGAGLLQSFLEGRREERQRRAEFDERERAVFHGAFSVSNFIAERLNDWDERRNVDVLLRLNVAEPYIAKLIDRSPAESDKLMVSLIDVGLRLDGLLVTAGYFLGLAEDDTGLDISELDQCVDELSKAVELVQLILEGSLDFMSDDELAEIAGVTVEELNSLTEGQPNNA